MNRKTSVCTLGLFIAVLALVCEAAPSTRPSGNVFIGGDVARSGVYPLGGPMSTVLSVVKWVGLSDDTVDHDVIVIRQINPKLEKTIRFNSLNALLETRDADIDLLPGDNISFHAIKQE